MTEETCEQVAQTGSRVVRDAIDLSGTPLRAESSANGHISASREALELSKLSAEREKIEPEVAQLRDGTPDAAELRRKIEMEREKNELELQKLRDDVANARGSRYFEFAKAFVPAGTIIASVWVAAYNLQYQRDKDRSVDVSQQLVHFQNQITATNDKTNEPDVVKQRNAIAAILGLREHAIPSLLANLDLDHDVATLGPLHQAVLALNEDRTLRQTILNQLMNSIRYAALRPHLKHLERYIALWRDCVRQYERIKIPKWFARRCPWEISLPWS
jgi:predicted  nucleic acid-binding Zn-ribbon protein